MGLIITGNVVLNHKTLAPIDTRLAEGQNPIGAELLKMASL